MFNRLYELLIRPGQKNEDLQNRELVLNVLLLGTAAMILCTVVIFAFSYGAGHHYMLTRLLITSGVLLLTCFVLYLSRAGWHKLAAWIFIIMYLILSTMVAACWGASMPSAAMLFGFDIMLTGVILGPRWPIFSALGAMVIITGLDIAESKGLLHPDLNWAKTPLDFGTVSGPFLLFGVIALVSRLFNELTGRSLKRARRAEEGLKRQKLLLESEVEKRTQELQIAQFEKIQQLYRFAELGQLSTALLHDLANHLATLTLDIEELRSDDRSLLKRAKRSIRYIDNMVLRVRDQLNGRVHVRQFNAVSETGEVINILSHKASEANVAINLELLSNRQDLRCNGEHIRFRQLMTNMLSNGIDAYDGKNSNGEHREVKVSLEAAASTIIITVTDWGKGVNLADQQKLFEPFYSTKKTGMGMGLFISKQIAENNFHGSISLDGDQGYTSFIITLSKN